jgi:hypothetical protein
MSLELFVMSIALTLAVVGGALVYLRAITRRVLLQLCGADAGDAGAEFWLRAADVLAIAGSLILVLAFGGALGSHDWVVQLRLVLGLALAGLFVTVVIVASSVWRFVPVPEGSRAAALPTAAAAPAGIVARPPMSPLREGL